MFSTSEKNNLRFIFTEITIWIFGTFIMVIVNFIFWYCLAYFSISRRWRIWDSRETTEVFTSFCCICNKAMRSSSSENYVDYVWASCYIQQRQFLNFPYLPISEAQCFLLYWEHWYLLICYEQKENSFLTFISMRSLIRSLVKSFPKDLALPRTGRDISGERKVMYFLLFSPNSAFLFHIL